MRLVQAKFQTESLSQIQDIYEKTIVPRLAKTKGCLCVVLMKSDTGNEGISLTLWDSKKYAEAYEKTGLYQKLLGEIKPYLSESSELELILSEELTLEYKPVPEEPVIKSYTLIEQSGDKMLCEEEQGMMYFRILSLKIQTDKMDEFQRIYREGIIPVLQKIKGCRYAYLTESTEKKDEAISVTIWDSKQDADRYETNGPFQELVQKVQHTFPIFSQWKTTLEKTETRKIITSEDMSIHYYHVVTGKSFR